MRKLLPILFVFVWITVLIATQGTLYAQKKQRKQFSDEPKPQGQCDEYNFKIGNDYSIKGEYAGTYKINQIFQAVNDEDPYEYAAIAIPGSCNLVFYVKDIPVDEYGIKTSDKLEIKVRLEKALIGSGRGHKYLIGYRCANLGLEEELVKQLVKRKEAAKNKLLQEASVKQNKIDVLVKKWSSSGPPKDFLGSQFQIYVGADLGNVCAVVEFLDKLNGKLKWSKNKDFWLLEQNYTDNATGKKYKIQWAFHDLRKDKGYIWLERAIAGGKEITGGILSELAAPICAR